MLRDPTEWVSSEFTVILPTIKWHVIVNIKAQMDTTGKIIKYPKEFTGDLVNMKNQKC